MKHKIIIATAILSILTFQLSALKAQPVDYYYNRPFGHLGITIGGGLNAMLYDNPAGKASPGLSLDLGLNYTHFFSGLGMGVGIHLASVGGSAVYNNEETSHGLTHANNPYAQYDLTTRFNDWHERQQITMLCLPLEAFYRIRLGNGRHIFTGLGVQFEMPMRGKYKAGKGSYTTTGLFPVGGPHTVSDMPEHGFSTYEETFDASIADFKHSFSIIADVGLHLPLNYSGGLYIGLFGSYGLVSILDNNQGTGTMLAINPDDPSLIDYYGTFAAAGNPSLHLLRIGIKLGIDLGTPMDN